MSVCTASESGSDLALEDLNADSLRNVLQAASPKSSGDSRKVDLDADNVGRGLAHLVLTVVRLLHELLERQAVRRMERGDLDDEEIERLGRTLMLQSDEIRAMADRFGLKEEDLNLDLGPLGKLL